MDVPGWLVASIVVSLVLTVTANVLLRWRPRDGRRLDDGVRQFLDGSSPEPSPGGHRGDNDGPRARVVFPWRLMIVISLALTVVANLVVALTR